MGNCFSTPSPSHHSTGPGPSPGIPRLPDTPAGGALVPGLQTEPGLTFSGLNNHAHGHGRPSIDHGGTGPRPLPDPGDSTPSNVKVIKLLNFCTSTLSFLGQCEQPPFYICIKH